ncbi:Lsr2 family protein [Streptomyces sp. NPDC092296]|uniref:histone-like nucleoid-structuring protein Lsr2 n=1 Tax=Streptomyces sp. NPDC092296 TaxID=3366012 RepID=UPI003803EA1E
MAKKTIVVCDITGEEGADTVEFAWEGTRYSIDLVDSERQKIDDFLAPYLKVAEEVTSGQRALPVQPGPDSFKVRKWAQENNILVDGQPLLARGRIPAAFVELYEKAHQEL